MYLAVSWKVLLRHFILRTKMTKFVFKYVLNIVKDLQCKGNANDKGRSYFKITFTETTIFVNHDGKLAQIKCFFLNYYVA